MKKGICFPSFDFLIAIIDNHHLQSVSNLCKPCRLVKNSLKWCKNPSLKVEVVVGKPVKDCWGKKYGAGENGKRRIWFFPYLIFNLNK